MSPLWLAVALAASEPPPLEVHHEGAVHGDAIVWHSTWRAASRCVPLAAPFDPPEPFTVEVTEGAILLCRPDDRAWSLHFERPFPADAVDLPLPAGTLQRIDVLGGRFVDPDGHLTKRMRAWTTPGVTRKERKHLDRDLPSASATTRLYVRPTAAVEGRLVPPGASRRVVYGTLAVFLAIAAILGLTYRRLERGARRERLERWLADGGADIDVP